MVVTVVSLALSLVAYLLCTIPRLLVTLRRARGKAAFGTGHRSYR